MFNDIRLRHDLIDAALQLTSLGLNKGTAGNVSVRLDEDRFLITPSGMPATTLSAKHLPVMTLGTPGEWTGPRKPSSEWRFHLDLYAARPEVGAVVHTHAPFCTTLACLQKDIPPFHYMVAVAGGKTIRCASYATFGTEALSKAALKALKDRSACLLAHHGMIATGPNLTAALKLAVEVEELAEQYWRCLQIAEPKTLSDAEMKRILEKFKGYGANAQKALQGEA